MSFLSYKIIFQISLYFGYNLNMEMLKLNPEHKLKLNYYFGKVVHNRMVTFQSKLHPHYYD